MYAKTLNTLAKFLNDRIIELFGLILVILSISLFASLATYSPNDPNFLYNPEGTTINNLFGLRGSIVSDFLLQSIGLVSFLLSINILIWGFKLIKKKSISNFLSKIFYTVIYILFGTSFIFIYNNNSFWLIDNGNSGFVGRIVNESLNNLFAFNENNYITIFLFLLTLFFFFIKY